MRLLGGELLMLPYIAGLGSLTYAPCSLADGSNGSVMFFVCRRLACHARCLPLGSPAHGPSVGLTSLMHTPFSRIWLKYICEATLGATWRVTGAAGECSLSLSNGHQVVLREGVAAHVIRRY